MLTVCGIFFFYLTLCSVAFADAHFIDHYGRIRIVKRSAQPEVGAYAETDFRFRFVDDHGRNKNATSIPPEVKEDALFLTPYIENGQIKEGQELATVSPMMENVESFSGYLTVNKTAESNLFFWLFKSQQGNWEERPLVIYLEGGPGTSSILTLFTDIGPFSVTKEQKLKRREYSWNRKYNLICFDNPVETGFSFTKMDSGYARNENDVARDLYEAIVQLYRLFPDLRKNKLIITGESYAGKYIPAIAYKISKMNKVSPFKINLAGLMIGNGFTDPIDMMNYGSFLCKVGLIDKKTRDKLILMEDETRTDIRAGRFAAADGDWGMELDEILAVTGFRYLYDFVHDDIGADGPETQFINNPKTKKALHVGSYAFNNGTQVYNHLQNDVMQSVKPWVEELLTAEEFPIMFFSGQLDIVVAYTLSVNFYNLLEWPYAKEYHNANRCQFKVGDEVAGYYKTAGTFTEVLVRNTGHTVSTSQPKCAFELLDRFITNSSSFKCD